MAETTPAPEAPATAAPVTLLTSDGQRFVVTRDVVELCKTILNLLDDCDDDGTPVPLPAVDASALTHLIVVANKCVDLKEEDKVREWFKEEYAKNLSQKELFDLLMAANYLNAKEVLNACCSFVASLIANKSPAEIREVFNIKNDFSFEEEQEVRRENLWAFE